MDAEESTDDVLHAISIFALDVFEGLVAVDDAGLHEDSDDTITFETNLVDGDLGSLKGVQDRVQSKHVATYLMVLEGMVDVLAQMLLVVLAESVADGCSQTVEDE